MNGGGEFVTSQQANGTSPEQHVAVVQQSSMTPSLVGQQASSSALPLSADVLQATSAQSSSIRQSHGHLSESWAPSQSRIVSPG